MLINVIRYLINDVHKRNKYIYIHFYFRLKNLLIYSQQSLLVLQVNIRMLSEKKKLFFILIIIFTS